MGGDSTVVETVDIAAPEDERTPVVMSRCAPRSLKRQRNVAAPVYQRHIGRVKTKKPAASAAEHKSSGMKLVEKYRPRMSRLTDGARQKLMTRGLQIIRLGHSSNG